MNFQKISLFFYSNKKILIFVSLVILIVISILKILIMINNNIDVNFEKPKLVNLAKYYSEDIMEEDYEVIFEQTGLSKIALSKIDDLDELEFYQNQYLDNYEISRGGLNSFTTEDSLLKNGKKYFVELADVQTGDLIVTMSNQTLGYNHGHTALVLDNNEILVVDSPFTKSYVTNIERITKFDTIVHLRLKNIDSNFVNEITSFAKNNLVDIPYTLINLKSEKEYDGAYCSLLSYYAYKHFGYDIDQDGGLAVTPLDMLQDKDMEVVQVFGLNIENYR